MGRKNKKKLKFFCGQKIISTVEFRILYYICKMTLVHAYDWSDMIMNLLQNSFPSIQECLPRRPHYAIDHWHSGTVQQIRGAFIFRSSREHDHRRKCDQQLFALHIRETARSGRPRGRAIGASGFEENGHRYVGPSAG